MMVTAATTAQQFVQGSGWHLESQTELASLERALKYFLTHVPLSVLNQPDSSSPWTPSRSRRTRLMSWLQGIRMSADVNPDRKLDAGQKLKQFRFHGDPMKAQGDWFTWESTRVDYTGLPNDQTAVRIFRLKSPITCLESIAADAFTGWSGDPKKSKDYHKGSAPQLFIYRHGANASSLEVIGGAK